MHWQSKENILLFYFEQLPSSPIVFYFDYRVSIISLGTIRSKLQFTATAGAFTLATRIINGRGWKKGKHLLKSASRAFMDYHATTKNILIFDIDL